MSLSGFVNIADRIVRYNMNCEKYKERNVCFRNGNLIRKNKLYKMIIKVKYFI